MVARSKDIASIPPATAGLSREKAREGKREGRKEGGGCVCVGARAIACGAGGREKRRGGDDDSTERTRRGEAEVGRGGSRERVRRVLDR